MHINSIKDNYLLSDKLPLIVLIGLFIAIFCQSFLISNKAYSNSFFEAISRECFYSKDSDQCISAVKKAEELQSIAGYEENYSCQTRILGLQSKLIMLMLDLPLGRSYLEDLNDAKKVCRGIF